MRFALLGDHPDGVEMACALVESGRHQLAAYTAAADEATLRRWGDARRVSDMEEVLADPRIEAVLVAGHLASRPAQLRRALQSERHVLCVHPPDQTPEAAYEAAMIRNDTGCLLFPLLPEALHPAVRRLAGFVERAGKGGEVRSPVGAFRLLEVEFVSTGEVLDNVLVAGAKPSLPGWDVLRTLGGEVAEVSAFAGGEELAAAEPVLVAGRFEQGGLFQVTLLPDQPAPRWRLAVVGRAGRAELLFPQGWQGPACLDWRDADGESREEYWERWDPWPALVEAFEAALARQAARPPELPEGLRQAVATAPGGPAPRQPPADTPPPDWQDAVRALELDDAARRSIERRRASLLEYPQASEEVGFKGTMTLAGCALLWGILLLLILWNWVPPVRWLIIPLLALFLGLQLLRYFIPRQEPGPPQERPRPKGGRPG
jgi:predicted dehydrogenase